MVTLPIDAVPDITNNQVQIVTISPTLAPQEVEQLISEQIQTVAGEIPTELGTPEMMPVTTGLGEIYQYTLDVAPG